MAGHWCHCPACERWFYAERDNHAPSCPVCIATPDRTSPTDPLG